MQVEIMILFGDSVLKAECAGNTDTIKQYIVGLLEVHRHYAENRIDELPKNESK